MRLIDADMVGIEMAETWQKVLVKMEVNQTPTIDPETLPIVQELRKQLEHITKERDAAFNLLVETCKDIRERTGEDYVCGLCEYDGAYISASGDWVNECPGFDTDDCFCIKKSIKEELGMQDAEN